MYVYDYSEISKPPQVIPFASLGLPQEFKGYFIAADRCNSQQGNIDFTFWASVHINKEQFNLVKNSAKVQGTLEGGEFAG